jgi:hypothetical protein
MLRFKVQIDGGQRMRSASDVAAALRSLADHLDNYPGNVYDTPKDMFEVPAVSAATSGDVHDAHGAMVGEWEVEPSVDSAFYFQSS